MSGWLQRGSIRKTRKFRREREKAGLAGVALSACEESTHSRKIPGGADQRSTRDSLRVSPPWRVVEFGMSTSRFEKFAFRLLARLPVSALQRIEMESGLALGKGWGTGTVRREVEAARRQLSRFPRVVGKGELVVLDVGANVGKWTESLLEAEPKARVYAFEPSTEGFRELAKKFSTMSNVQIVKAAVGNVSGSATLWSDTPGSGLASLTRRKLDHFNIDFDVSEEVDVVTLDEWCEFNEVSPNLIKVDVEGHELDVLSGGVNTLKSVDVVQFEFGGCNIDTRTYFQDFWYFFNQLGFKLYRVAPRGVLEISKYRELDEAFRTTNFLAVSRRKS